APGGAGERAALLVHAVDAPLRRVAVLDAVINNADRKGGHLLPQADGSLYAIDHGVTFHTDDKLRTLLWGWAGEELPAEASAALRGLADALAPGAALATRLAELLSAAEVDAVRKRTDALLTTGRHPLPGGAWPAIPWPPV
ncbi:SCO1664 family protein, partial [Streptomyces sparsus]